MVCSFVRDLFVFRLYQRSVHRGVLEWYNCVCIRQVDGFGRALSLMCFCLFLKLCRGAGFRRVARILHWGGGAGRGLQKLRGCTVSQKKLTTFFVIAVERTVLLTLLNKAGPKKTKPFFR